MPAAARKTTWRERIAALCAAGATVCAAGFLIASAVGRFFWQSHEHQASGPAWRPHQWLTGAVTAWALWMVLARGWRAASAERRRAPVRLPVFASVGALALTVLPLALRRMFRAYRRVLFHLAVAPHTPLPHILWVYLCLLSAATALWLWWAPRRGRVAAGAAAGVLIVLSAYVPVASVAPVMLPLVFLGWAAVAAAWQAHAPPGGRRAWLSGSLVLAACAVTGIGLLQPEGPSGAWRAIGELFSSRLLPRGVKELVYAGMLFHLTRGGRSEPLLGAACGLAVVGFAWAAWLPLPRTPAALLALPLVAALAGGGAQELWSSRWVAARRFSRNLVLVILLGLLAGGVNAGFDAGTLAP